MNNKTTTGATTLVVQEMALKTKSTTKVVPPEDNRIQFKPMHWLFLS